MTPLLTKTEVADLLHVSIRSVDRLRLAGQLPALRVRGRIRFDPEDVRAFLDGQRRGSQRIPTEAQ